MIRRKEENEYSAMRRLQCDMEKLRQTAGNC
jgi:hypothetical protein